MRAYRRHSCILLALLLPLPVRAELTPVGAPLVISEGEFCAFSALTDLEVVATPQGAFEVIWPDEGEDYAVKGQRFARNLAPTGSPQILLPLHGGLFFSEVVGTWAGRYEVALNAADFDSRPADPLTSYRIRLNLEGDPLAPAARFKPPRFLKITPAAGGHSLQFRAEPPVFDSLGCRGLGLLAGRISTSGIALTAESRVTRRATPWDGVYLAVDRLPNDTFVAAYSTCNGLVARRLNASGATVGNPINLQMKVGNFGGGNNLVVAAHNGTNFAVGAMVYNPPTVESGGFVQGVVNGQAFGPTPLSAPTGLGVSGVLDLAALPDGGYLILFQGVSGEPDRRVVFAQELDAQGVPQGTPVAVTGDDGFGVAGAVASLPNGRWIVVTRTQRGDISLCSERIVGTVLASD